MQNARIRISQLMVMAVVALLALTACQAAFPAAAGSPDFNLTLVHSNDTWGYIDPCG